MCHYVDISRKYYDFCLKNYRKFDILLANWFLRKLCFNKVIGLHYKRHWLKGQRQP